MPQEFAGPATPMTETDIAGAAAALGCEVAVIKAIIDVESRGGFFADGRPKILFERHRFSRLTAGRFDAGHPDVSSPTPGGYKGGPAEYDRLGEAILLDRGAALKSASWGAFQIMGDNFGVAGFADVESFVRAMCRSETDQLRAFIGFVRGNGLAEALQRHDWEGFARAYNGPGFKKNDYDTKLADAYRAHASGTARPAARVLRQGDRGDDVAALQKKLGVTANGEFGPETLAAVVALQTKAGLDADGIVGPRTRARLGF